MTIVLNGTTGITNDGGYTGDGVVFADTTPANTLVTTTGGNVGIGTSSPNVSYKLHVEGNILATGNLRIEGTQLRVAGTSSAASPSIQPGEDGDTGMFWPGANIIGFSTAGSERARIDTSGNLLVGTTSQLNGYNIPGSIHSLTTDSKQLNLRNSNATASRVWTLGMTAGSEFLIYANGTTGQYMSWNATSWTASSDERAKDIIEPINNAVEKVATLRAVIGKYKTDDEGTRRAFLIAQDVQKVLPEAIDIRSDEQGTLGLRYTDTIPLLVAAIKEQQAIITALTARVAALEGTQNV